MAKKTDKVDSKGKTDSGNPSDSITTDDYLNIAEQFSSTLRGLSPQKEESDDKTSQRNRFIEAAGIGERTQDESDAGAAVDTEWHEAGNGKQVGAGRSDENDNDISGSLGNQGNEHGVGNAGGATGRSQQEANAETGQTSANPAAPESNDLPEDFISYAGKLAASLREQAGRSEKSESSTTNRRSDAESQEITAGDAENLANIVFLTQ